MPNIYQVFALGVATLTLTGCSVFYPNWGATTFPEAPTSSESEVATETQEPEEAPEPEPTATEAPTEEPTKEPQKRKEISVDVIMAAVDAEAKVLTVIAQIPSLSETGGKCVFKFVSGSTSKTLEVKAEPSSDYTQCFPIEYPLADLPAGNGVVTVSYESEGHFGTSAPQSVVIG